MLCPTRKEHTYAKDGCFFQRTHFIGSHDRSLRPNQRYRTTHHSADVDLTISGKVGDDAFGGEFPEQATILKAYMAISRTPHSSEIGRIIEGSFDPKTEELQITLPATIPDDLLGKGVESFCQEGKADLTTSVENLRVSHFSELYLDAPDDSNGGNVEDGYDFGFVAFRGSEPSGHSGSGHWFYSNAPARVTGTCTYTDPYDSRAFNPNLNEGWNYVVLSGGRGNLPLTYTSVETFPEYLYWYHDVIA